VPDASSPIAGLRRVINAWGTPTPYGVSRSDAAVAEAAAAMLQRNVVMADLQALAGRALADWAGAPSGCVTHCTASAVTLAVAGCMADAGAGPDPRRLARHTAQLPDAGGMPRRVALLAAHQVNYGHAITQAVRLAGAEPVPCDTPADVPALLAQGGFACVLAVESQLASAAVPASASGSASASQGPGAGPQVTRALVDAAHAAGLPLVLDAAAQDWRARALAACGADLVLFSGQKYLRSPTAGLVVGAARWVAALDAQHGGIGRGMKPSKESLAGVLAALARRAAASPGAWRAAEQLKVDTLAAAAAHWPGVRVLREPDPLGNGFDRLWLAIDPGPGRSGDSKGVGTDAATVAQRLRDGMYPDDPVVAVAPHRLAQGQIGLELTGVDVSELDLLCKLLAAAIIRPQGGT